MLVTRESFDRTVEHLSNKDYLAIDTETTSLSPYKDGKLFAIIIADEDTEYYFNFNPMHERYFNDNYFKRLVPLFEQPNISWWGHNLGFDIAFLAKENLRPKGPLFCTQATGRLIWSDLPSYSLASLAPKVGCTKDTRVDEYIRTHHLYETLEVPGKQTTEKRVFYQKVPLEIMYEYGKTDARIVLKLRSYYLEKINERGLRAVFENESKLVSTVSRMVERGVLVDKSFALRALQYESSRLDLAAQDFKLQTGRPYKASPKMFAEVFASDRPYWEFTEKQNPSFDSKALAKFANPAAKSVLEVRLRKSNMDFYAGMLHHMDDNNVIHTNFKQSGTVTGRFSSSTPNLQNLTSEEGEDLKNEFVVRRAFVPRKDHCFIMIDYSAVEYKFLLDTACKLVGRLTPLAREVLAGKDVHQATADIASSYGVNISRKTAKCIVEGSLVLTNNGLKPIESVTDSDLVWDGVEYVSHGGVVYNGEQEVIEHEGLTGTEDHVVYGIDGNEYTLKQAKQRKVPLMVCEVKGEKIRIPDNFISLAHGWRTSFSSGFLQKMQSGVYDTCRKYLEVKNYQLQMSARSYLGSGCSNTKTPGAVYGSESTLHDQYQKPAMQKLWLARNSNAANRKRMGGIFQEKLHSVPNFELDYRQDRQQRPLRVAEYPVSSVEGESKEQEDQQNSRLQRNFYSRHGFMEIFKKRLSKIRFTKRLHLPASNAGILLGGDPKASPKSTRKVYDIQNAGPRHRYTVSGKLVHNCVNFLSLYGGGVKKLADMIGCTELEARSTQEAVFKAAPELRELNNYIINTAKSRGWVKNWLGRRYEFPNPNLAYRATNYVVQGSCADILKVGLNKIETALQAYKSKLILTIHDENIIECHKSEISVVPKLVSDIMTSVYEHKYIPLTCSMEFSWVSLADKYEGYPSFQKEALGPIKYGRS